ncbi:NlpC/P60 family protein [Breznakiella homolactica]|uniref:C40 family peptidase n=1 Tax=Breznakiella homolactica TaxID=2798577 RepID=A0A7T7XPQ2_9SPIR|nr:NlpC/P60 family protein [Breznakiella homolactica]QQO10211.1 C40 family peptidase [Breznakiella homolactica]
MDENELYEVPDFIAEDALSYAYMYVNSDTEYEYGGQDFLRAIKIDCSGLVVNCYVYAVEGTEFIVPFSDAAVTHFYTNWTVSTADPRPGDILFMGDDYSQPSHMGLFVKEDNGNIYFIDSTFKPENNIDGVTERFYPKNDRRFLSFGKLLLHKRR